MKFKNTFGLASFANTIPAIHVELKTPMILWIHMTTIACGHSSLVALDPYLKASNLKLNSLGSSCYRSLELKRSKSYYIYPIVC